MVIDAVNYIGTPGEIIGVNKDAFFVKTGDSVVKISSYDILTLNDSTVDVEVKIGNRLV